MSSIVLQVFHDIEEMFVEKNWDMADVLNSTRSQRTCKRANFELKISNGSKVMNGIMNSKDYLWYVFIRYKALI